MASKEVRLISGVIALIAIYATGNVLYQSLRSDDPPANDPQQVLIARGQRLIGTASDFAYSPAIKKLQGSWTSDRLVTFLTAPQKYVPGTKMAVQGWPEADAKAIAAYLESRD